MKVTNQKPAVLSPHYKGSAKGDFNPLDFITESISKQLYNPLNTNHSVSITDGGKDITEDIITEKITLACDDTINPQLEDWLKDLFTKTMVYFGKTLNINSLFVTQSAVKAKMQFPTQAVIYTPTTDVIPASKGFLAGTTDYDEYFATMAFYTKANTFGIYFATESVFDDFKVWLMSQIQTLNSVLSAKTVQMFTDFSQLKLNDLTESLIIRNDVGDNNEEFSFARTLVYLIMQYQTQANASEYGLLPFCLSELYCPKTIVMVNVEKHAHATAKQIADEWNLINKSLQMKPKIMNNNKIQKLTSTLRNLKKYQTAAAAQKRSGGVQKAVALKFRSKAPTSVELYKIIRKIMDKMAFVSKSQNIYRMQKPSFMRPNRRNPDDYNAMGKSTSTKYKPDIHIYADTSGSISEENYQDTVKACIVLAKKLNVNMYFNSFSHVMSQSTLLQTRDHSVKAIYNQFQKIPKVTGGTDYEQIWEYINASPKRKREISIIITDFEWNAPNHMVSHPKNLYYVPCSRMDWDYMVQCAKGFAKSMMHIDSKIRKKMLF